MILKVIQGGVGFVSGTEASSLQNVTQSLLPLSLPPQYGDIYNFPSTAFEKALDEEELPEDEVGTVTYRAVLSVQQGKALKTQPRCAQQPDYTVPCLPEIYRKPLS